jgi:pimeloyl-ACP methyl ester carboxylesterase
MSAAPLHVEETAGRDPTVVLLHHGMGSVRAWDGLLPHLTGGRRAIAYDRRGFGRSPRDTAYGPDLFGQDAEDLAQLLTRHDAAPAHLVGHSDGGSVALLTAARSPALVRSVVVVAMHVRADAQTRETLQRFGPPPTWDAGMQAHFRSAHGEDWLAVTSAWYRLWQAGLSAWDLEPELARISCPVLVIHDRQDELAATLHAEAVARRVPQAEVSWYETGSHMPHRADRRRFLEQTTAFWVRVEAS